MKTRSQRRHTNWAKAARKRQIALHAYGFEYYDTLHKYSKNKIHCSCPMCSQKTNNKSRKRCWFPLMDWPVRDLKRIAEMKYEENDLKMEVDATDHDKVKVEVLDLAPFANDKYIGFKILWSGTPGFGEYTIYRGINDDVWHADSEYMDSQDDKWFIKLLLKDLVDKRLVIDG